MNNGVVLSGISKSYDKHRVLDGISLRIKNGEFISIVGKYGTGKTTLLKLLAGLVNPDAGSIAINGELPKVLLKKRKIGFAFQDSSLLPWRNVLKNITLPLEINNERNTDYAIRLLRIVGLEEKKNARPHELSGGMQRIVAILRALVLMPDILILDEPFSSIDEINRNDLHEKLIAIHKSNKQTAIMVTHSIEEAVYLSDKVVVLGGSPAKIVRVFDIKSSRQKKNRYGGQTMKQVNEIRNILLESR
jgi:NitT/TauT family transport system ATP-binding protein